MKITNQLRVARTWKQKHVLALLATVWKKKKKNDTFLHGHGFEVEARFSQSNVRSLRCCESGDSLARAPAPSIRSCYRRCAFLITDGSRSGLCFRRNCDLPSPVHISSQSSTHAATCVADVLKKRRHKHAVPCTYCISVGRFRVLHNGEHNYRVLSWLQFRHLFSHIHSSHLGTAISFYFTCS